MAFDIKEWIRVDGFGVPVYINPEQPSWFVPNTAGDTVLKKMAEEGGNGDLSFSHTRFLHRLPQSAFSDYDGRGDRLSLKHIRELWFHITNRCNLSCRHCLFASGPGDAASLEGDYVLKTASDAYHAGCRVFALTGGEPFVHGQIEQIVKGLLAFGDTHVILLTNGKNLKSHLSGSGYDFQRLHLQISVDGLGENHDRLRGKGAFESLVGEFAWLKSEKIPFTVSMCPTLENLSDMPGMVKFAAESGASNLHFMWYFIRGRGGREKFVLPEKIFDYLARAADLADSFGIGIDNIDALKTQVFAPQGTIHDGSTTGWESLAVGPDGFLYPSPAMIGVEALKTSLAEGVEHAWKNSPVLNQIRRTTVCSDPSPMKYILGGGDSDHSYAHGKTFSGDDPYLPLLEKTALWLISREAKKLRNRNAEKEMSGKRPGILLKMGDILESCGAHDGVALTHPNCLLAMADKDSRTVVKEFYSEAAARDNEEILNPVCYDESLISHIPPEDRFRGYGCGSPVLDADIKEGEHVVDLGSGRGIECFIAARMTGRSGRVTGVDMLDPMLETARETAKRVVAGLGYQNIEFRKGFLEKLPLENNSTHVILSNCVMNLSVNKRASFGEIYRVLKKGGRLVISDVVCDEEPPAFIRNDEILKGECIAGAMTQGDLMGILEETGFRHIRILKRFPYREVRGHRFHSLTYEAVKPAGSHHVRVMYRGPFRSVETAGGTVLSAGVIREIPEDEAELLSEQLYILDEHGAVTSHHYENTCCSCATPPPEERGVSASVTPMAGSLMMSGCMSCGAPLIYLSDEIEKECVFCGKVFPANATCDNGHFICDGCHSKDAVAVMKNILFNATGTDMLALLSEIRRHPAIPLHGPEHHALVPGVIVAAYRNAGGEVGIDQIETALNRGNRVPGGNCGFNGVCGAAEGVGIGFSVILEANPMKPVERQVVQKAVQSVLARIADIKAARCCQRECWIALKQAAELSAEFLPLTLKADYPLICTQKSKNSECIGKACPLS